MAGQIMPLGNKNRGEAARANDSRNRGIRVRTLNYLRRVKQAGGVDNRPIDRPAIAPNAFVQTMTGSATYNFQPPRPTFQPPPPVRRRG